MRRRTLTLVCILAAVCSLWAWAQTEPPASGSSLGPTSTINGKVVSVSPTSLVIETDAGTQMTLAMDVTSSQPATLKPGDKVAVEYHTLASGNYHVADVELEVAPAAPTAPATTQPSPTEPTAADPGTPSEFGTAPSDVVPDVVPTMDDTLPQTASSLPLVVLTGVLALVGAAALHRTQRRA